MKKILSVLYLLFAFTVSFGQLKQPQTIGGKNTRVIARDQLGADSLFLLPNRDTNFIPDRPGAMIYRGVDKTPYVWNGSNWEATKGGGSGGTDIIATAPLDKTGSSLTFKYNNEGLKLNDNNSLEAKAKVFGSFNHLRGVPFADTMATYAVYENKDFHYFKYDPDDITSQDDTAMVIVAGGKRFKRIVNETIYPEDFGAKGDGSDDSPFFNKMYRWVEANSNNVKEVKHKHASYFFASTVYLPGNLAVNGKLLNLRIEGKGVVYRTTNPITILERWPSSQTQALNEYISDYALELSGIRFEGNSTSGQVGARLGAMYTPVLEGCHFASLDTGVVAAFWLNGRINKNFFTNNKSVAFKGSSGYWYWSGATTSNSAFNINEFSGNRIFNGSGSYAGLFFSAADGLLIKDHISEGFNPRYDIYNDSEATTVVNGNTYRNIWFESTGGVYAKNTCFYLRNNGTTVIDGLQNDYADTLVKFVSTAGGSEFIFQNIQYYNVSGKILDAGGLYTSGSSITVSNCSYQFSKIFTDTTYWVGGVVGFNAINQAFKPSGSGYTLQSNTAINIEPHFGSSLPNANRSVTVHGGFNFGTDNQFYIGGSGANVRPNRISIGTGGIRVDKSAAFGIGFADNAANPKIYWRSVNDSLSQIVGTGALQMPQGTTDQRTLSGVSGSFRLNTTLLRPEITYSNQWKQLLTNDDTVSIHVRILKNLDSLIQHNLRLSALENSPGGGGPETDPVFSTNGVNLTANQTITGIKTFATPFTTDGAIANFGTNANSNIVFKYGSSSDITSLNIGNNFSLTRNGGSAPSIVTSLNLLTTAAEFRLNSTSNAPGKLLLTGNFGSGAAYFGASNSAASTLYIGNYSSSTFTSLQNTYGIGTLWSITDGFSPVSIPASSIFSLHSTTRGFLPPRMTAAQRLAISSPANGLVVYDTDSSRLFTYSSSTWKGLAYTNELGSGGPGGTSSETLVTPNDADYTISTGTGNLTVVYFNTLTAERLVTQPDPATNTGRIFTLKHGGGGLFNLNLSVPIHENSTTTTSSIAPGVSIQYMSDGTKFIKIR